MGSVSKFLIALGVAFILAGVFWPYVSKLGSLPGDLKIEGAKFKAFFPITTSILISLIISGILWLLRRFF